MTLCARCAADHDGDLGPWCATCEEVTGHVPLVALLYADGSAIYGLYEVVDTARDAMRVDREAVGQARLILQDVVGQQGARALVDQATA